MQVQQTTNRQPGVIATFLLPLARGQQVVALARRDGVIRSDQRGDISATLRHALTVGLATLKSAEVQDART